jgi:hypothetical protein
MSRNKRVRLRGSASDEHIIVFYKGEMVDILCPKRTNQAGESPIAGKD